MLRSMFSGVSGLKCHQTMLDVIGNNIANVNTAGFKASRVVFTDVFYQTMSGASGVSTAAGGINSKQIGYGSTIGSVDVLNTRSGFQQTDLGTDLYISGDGFFVTEDGTGNKSYTRVGNFKFDTEGSLVDANGNYVCGQLGASGGTMTTAEPLKFADLDKYTDITIGTDGKVTGVSITDKTVVTLGQIALASFPNPDGLTQDGNLYMAESPNSGTAVIAAPGGEAVGSLVVGGLEMSNVDLSTELTNMIIAQRGFQANSKVITTSDEILQELVNLKR